MVRARLAFTTALAAAVAALALGANVAAQDKQLYRYTDANGKVVYSDQPPPAGAKDVQAKRLGDNVIETNELPLSARIASERYPVTLYTFNCGEPCEGAEALLNRRGVPFTTVNVNDPAGIARLKTLTGGDVAPVLQVGDKLVSKGLNESRWQAMLDEAGYPKTPPARRFAPGKGTEAPPVASTPAAPPPAPAAAAAGGGYPK